jgi:uncharacterized protein
LLRETFVHIPTLGLQSEASLWSQGCQTWDDFLAEPERFTTGAASRALVTDHLRQSVKALEEGSFQYFTDKLGSKNHWRAFPEFRDRTLYLDIETDGGTSGDSVTMIGLYDGKEFTCLTRDEGLGAFPDIVSQYSCLVTFWGTGFDLPMLKKKFPGLVFDQLHLDLCFAFRQVGVRGGLKAIEKSLGLTRVEEAEGLTGRDAIWLWRRWEVYGDEQARKSLIAYNREDVVNMETLAEIVYGRLREQTLSRSVPHRPN